MFSGFEVRIACPSISFLFACLGGSLGVFPHLENFVFKGNSMSAALADLLSLLHQLIDWFESLVREQEIMSGLLSSGDPVEGDTTVSSIQKVRASHTFEEVCRLDVDTLGRFKDRFQFPE